MDFAELNTLCLDYACKNERYARKRNAIPPHTVFRTIRMRLFQPFFNLRAAFRLIQNGSISEAHMGIIPCKRPAGSKPPLPENRLPSVSVRLVSFLLFILHLAVFIHFPVTLNCYILVCADKLYVPVYYDISVFLVKLCRHTYSVELLTGNKC